MLMQRFITFKRTALLMLMCMAAAWCLPAKGQENNGYDIYGLAGDDYLASNSESCGSCSFNKPEGAPEDIYVLFQLNDVANASDFQLIVNGVNSGPEGQLLFLLPKSAEGGNDYFGYCLRNTNGSQNIGKTFRYTISLYGTADASGDPLATFTGSRTVVEPLFLTPSPSRLSGAVSEAIPFTIKVEANGFSGKNAILQIRKKEGMTVACSELTESQDDYYWSYQIADLQNATYHFTLSSTQEIHETVEVRILDSEGNSCPDNAWIPVSIPFNGSQDDIAGLQKIATDNNNAYLNEYVSSKGYLNEDHDSIYIHWDESVSPARLSSINFRIPSLTTLDVSAFESLEYLTVSRAAITSLDVSMLKQLRSVELYNTGITSLNQVTLPENQTVEVRGENQIFVGEPINEYEYQLVSGDTVDLSLYATIEGEAAIIKWFKRSEGPEIEMQWESAGPGKFVVPAPDEADAGKWAYYWCEISTEKYPNWKLRSWDIQIVRGSNIEYSAADIQLLKNLAAANPDCHELQQFVADDVQGWTEPWDENYWNDRNRKVAVDWTYGTPARISKLRIRSMNTIKSLDLSGFTELTYLDVSQLSEWLNEQQKYIGLETLDLSHNTKLKILEAEESGSIQTLNLSGLSALEEVNVRNAHNVTVLDLSASKSTLTKLIISGCDRFTIDLTQFSALEYLYIGSTEQYADAIKNLPGKLKGLDCTGTKYPLLDFSVFPDLLYYGVPMDITSVDISKTWIQNIDFGETKVRYSTFTPNQYTNQYSCNGRSEITIDGLTESEESFRQGRTIYDIAVGDTVDLSSEAKIGNIDTRYVWVDEYDRTESNGVFIPVEGEPGKFIYNGGGRANGFYYCLISNDTYCEMSEINMTRGWVLETCRIMLPEIKATYAPAEVAALKAIVDGNNSPALKEWWDSGKWQNGESENGRIHAYWMLDELTNTFHLESLQLHGLGDTLQAVDVSAFTELVNFSCDGSGLARLSLANNNKLISLQVNNSPSLTALTLPEAKESLETLYLLWNSSLETIDVSGYTNLNTLNLRSCGSLTSAGDLSRLANLEYMWLNNTQLEVETSNNNYPNMRKLGVSTQMDKVDISQMELLESLDLAGANLKFSDVKVKAGKTYQVEFGQTELTVEDFRATQDGYYLMQSGKTSNILATEMKVGETATVVSGTATVDADGRLTVSGKPLDRIELTLTNAVFSGWKMKLKIQVCSVDGDANLDTAVDVRDIPVTVNYIIQSPDALPKDKFGFYEADVDHNNEVNVADLQGIINLILNPQTRSNSLRADYVPAVELSVENGILYMDAETAIASLQLELTGMAQAEPFLGKAAALTQASTVGDTTRIVGYSLKGATIPAGKSALMKFPTGTRLAKAVFADEKAQRLNVRTKGDIATSNETIRVAASHEVYNYPNPFRTTTTIAYTLDTEADAVTLQVYNMNGALVDIVQGLGTQTGESRFSYTTRLNAGMYVYRLAISRQGTTNYSKSNTFIIK